jgi:iron complex outermembrane receptor protein
MACNACQKWIAVALAIGLAIEGRPAAAQSASEADLTALSIEQLMNIQVTSAAKVPQKLNDATSAIFVITQDDIQRSGVSSIPELLRMVPGVQVARIDSNAWAITARGFASRFADKLLVLIDGRTIYSPLFSGVFWDRHDIVLEDIDRIEVIRGPGAALWGANAVNGVINIITKSSKETQGTLASVATGTEERGEATARYGGALSEDTTARLYAKYFDERPSTTFAGMPGGDEWQYGRVGFRADGRVSESDSWTAEGEFFADQAGQFFPVPSPTAPYSWTASDFLDTREGNLLGRWNHVFEDHSDLTVQGYFDHSGLSDLRLSQSQDIGDLDIQHHFQIGTTHDIIWGGGYRVSKDYIGGGSVMVGTTPYIAANPSKQTFQLFNTFGQDTITLLPGALAATIGTKLEVNSYDGLELEPSASLLWTPSPTSSVWASVSRAVRTPSRGDEDVSIVAEVAPTIVGPLLVITKPNANLKAENLVAYQVGYRTQFTSTVSFDVTGFYNDYGNLIGGGAPIFLPAASAVEVPLNNAGRAQSYGAELLGSWQAARRWRIEASYTYLQMRSADSGADNGQSPTNEAGLRSLIDLTPTITLDAFLRYVGKLPALNVPGYAELNLHVGWRPIPSVELGISGENLLHAHHAEFGSETLPTLPTYVQRSVLFRAATRF